MQIATMNGIDRDDVKRESKENKDETLDVVSLPDNHETTINTFAPSYNISESRYAEATTSSYMSNHPNSLADVKTSYFQSDFCHGYSASSTSPPYIDKAPSFVSRTPSTESVGQSGDRPSPSSTPPEDKHVWTKAEVELLLDLYEKHQDQLKDPRVRKTRVWEDIARVIRENLNSDINGCQCNQKFRNLKADFQKVQEHNGRPGNFKRICKYYDRLVNLLNYSPYNHHKTFPNSLSNHKGETLHPPLFYDANHFSQSINGVKRKPNDLYMNGHIKQLNNGCANNKKMKVSCQCECSEEIANLRDCIEKTNRYIIARAAHEDDRIRRLEEIHREKLIAIGRFADIFKDYIHKIV